MEILDVGKIESAQSTLELFKAAVENSIKSLSTLIAAFEKNEMVQSLFISGGFGESQKNELEKIKDGLTEYQAIISGEGGLYSVTEQYLNNQLARTQ